MRLQILLPLTTATLFLAGPVWAQPEGPVPEIVVTTEASAPASTPVVPQKGMSKSAVSSQYGAPQAKRPPVGGASRQQPPITRWDYDGYSVFFEYDHVVDTVIRDQPAPIAVYDGLAGGPQ